MRFTKPSWVIHNDSAKSDHTSKRLSIFSVHVHPDGSRIATGGLDAKIRIWSTKPILNRSSELSNKPPKSLCTLTMHTGPVLTVRWAHSGRWLASGSDDEIVMVWDLDPNARGKVWGSDEVNVEGWKPLKRLPGHESDVTDVAWSPSDRYLASVGLDSKVIIWCGYTLDRLHKIDQHQGFVKGVCWDPVGEFLATQSDDRSVKIWRTRDWTLEAEVTKPFEDSPGSTFFRRLSWSPDGAHITASNATNNKGLIFIAAVIARNTWTSEISLVGHENTVEVAAYNPHIFLRNPSAPVATSNICSVVALGADDRSVSVWQTKSARPLIVAKEVFERQIMDLSWSWDGLTLYAASSDGTLGVFNFDSDELEGIAPHSVQEQYLTKFGFQLPPVPEGYSHVPKPEPKSQMTPPPSPSRAPSTGFGATNGTTPTGGGGHINMLVAKRGKKRATLASATPAVSGASSLPTAQPPSTNILQARKRGQPLNNDITMRDSSPKIPSSSSQSFQNSNFPAPAEQPFGAPDSWSRHIDLTMDVDVPIDSLDTTSSVRGKRKASAADLPDDTRVGKFRTLGGDRTRDIVPVKEIRVSTPSGAEWSSGVVVPGLVAGSSVLPVPPLLTVLSSEVEGTDDVFEAKNSENDDPTELMFVSGKQTQWLDFLPSPVLAIKATSHFCVAAMRDGCVNVYSHTGRRIMPTLSLGSPCAFLDGSKTCLVVLTATGQLYSWNTKTQTSYFPPTSIQGILSSSPNHIITSLSARPTGIPIINCSNGAVYSYDPALMTFVKLTERWWAEGSDAWQGRQRTANQSVNRGIMSSVEGSIVGTPDENGAEKQRPQWWSAAMTLGHLETRIHATRLLDSPQEYKQALLVYAKRIADEGFRAKAEELIKELFGPLYWRPGRDDGWVSTVAGLSKRDLLKDVLSIFARSKTLTKLALDWQDILKKVSLEES